MPIAAAGYADNAAAAEKAVGATVAYALMYAAVNLGAFAVAALVGRTRRLNRVSDYRGLYARSPLAALVLGFFLLCLAGLPPGIIGLFAKVTVFSAAVDAGLGWLAVVMAVNVVIALYYYLQWTALLFRAPEGEPVRAPRPGPPHRGHRPDRGPRRRALRSAAAVLTLLRHRPLLTGLLRTAFRTSPSEAAPDRPHPRGPHRSLRAQGN